MNGGYFRPSPRGSLKSNRDQVRPDQPVDAEVQNVPNARVYVFGNADCTENELNEEGQVDMPELRARGAARKQYSDTLVERDEEPEYFERPIAEEDTLQSLALKYGCPMSELKRINNLIRDQDFFGRKTLRIPLRRHGLLSEMIQENNKGGNPSSAGATGGIPTTSLDLEFESNYKEDDSEETDLEEETDSEHRKLLVRTLSIRDSFGTQSKDAVEFLKKMDNDIKSIIKTANSRKETLEEVRETLTCKSIHPLQNRKSIFDGVDCGMRWWSVLLVTFVLLVGAPLLYFLYFEFVRGDS